MIVVTVLTANCQVSTLCSAHSVGTHNPTTSTQIVKNQPLETHWLVCVANLSNTERRPLTCEGISSASLRAAPTAPDVITYVYFFDGMKITTISVRMEKNTPRIPHPRGLRPFIAAMTPHTMAAMMLPIATNMPLMPRRINPAASG